MIQLHFSLNLHYFTNFSQKNHQVVKIHDQKNNLNIGWGRGGLIQLFNAKFSPKKNFLLLKGNDLKTKNIHICSKL
jgi:hypothetical protein